MSSSIRGPAGVVAVLDRAAAAAAGAELVAIAAERHVHANDVVPGVLCARGSDGGVDSSGQRCEYLHGVKGTRA